MPMESGEIPPRWSGSLLIWVHYVFVGGFIGDRGVRYPLQSLAKYLKLALAFMQSGAVRKSLISVFQEFFASINKNFVLARALGATLLFYEVWRLS